MLNVAGRNDVNPVIDKTGINYFQMWRRDWTGR